MLTAVALATALVTAPQDKWELKPNLAPKASITWSVVVKADMGGDQHEATFKLVQENMEPEVGKPLPARLTWKDLEVDGGSVGEEPVFDVKFGDDGSLVPAETNDDESVRRMLSPMVFSYPTKAVGPGDTFESKVSRSGRESTVTQTVVGVEKVKGEDALKITSTSKETGSEAMEVVGTWWIAKDGRPLKFESRVKNWFVTMAGPDVFDATITGELSP